MGPRHGRRAARGRSLWSAPARAAACALAFLLACRSEPASPAVTSPAAAPPAEEIVGEIRNDGEPVALDAAVFGEPRAREAIPLEIEGLEEGRWLGNVDVLEDRWGIGRPKDPAAAPELSVIGGIGGDEIAFGWHSSGAWRLALAARTAGGAYRVVARSREGYEWIDWPALRPGRREIAVWIVGNRSSRLARFEQRDDLLAESGAGCGGYEKYWPLWSPDGEVLLARAIRIFPSGGHDEFLLAGGAVALAGSRVENPTFLAAGREWACVVHRRGGAFVCLSDGREIGPFDDADRPRATKVGFELAALRGRSLLRVRVGARAEPVSR
jgi:hypothetical protein